MNMYPKSEGNYSLVLPKADQLLKIPVDRTLNVEDELSTPNDSQVFLAASIAFLQKMLLTNSTSDVQTPRETRKKYSNHLIFELKTAESTERFFVRVKNIEKYDEMMREEATTPSSTLSFDHLLPNPKRPKKNSSFLNLFSRQSVSNCRLLSKPSLHKSLSVFTIFRRSDKSKRNGEGKSLPPEGSAKIPSSKESLESSTLLSVESSSIRFAQEPPKRREKHGLLTKTELDILNIIPSHPKNYPKLQNRSYTHGIKQPRLLSNLTVDSRVSGNNGVGLKSGPSMTNFQTSCRLSPRNQPSKLSVCVEDEGMSDEDLDLYSRSGFSEYSCNLTDEVKSNFSQEAAEIIMRRLMQYFEYNPEKNRKHRK